MLHAVCYEWEHSRHDDSDWYQVVYNDETGDLEQYTTFTTMYPCEKVTLPVTTDRKIIELANDRLADFIISSICDCWYEPAPGQINPGETAIIPVGITVGARESCPKCNGTGEWVNPKRTTDKRICFTCDGFGVGRSVEKTRLSSGTVVTLVSSGSVKDRAGRESNYYVVNHMGKLYKVGRVRRDSSDCDGLRGNGLRKRVIEFISENPHSFYAAFRTTHKEKRLAEYLNIDIHYMMNIDKSQKQFSF